MSAFTHVHPDGGRFSTAKFGAYYAARELPTAIAEAATAGFTSIETDEERQRIAPKVLSAVSDSTDFDVNTYHLKLQLAQENEDGD
mgnify:CR=1 FL=1